jgi:outer membrane protein assembly factor BamB
VAEAAASMPEWGRSGSPLVLGDRVIVSVGSSSEGSLAAYDARSGARLWSGGSDAASYSSPVRLTLAGREQVVVLNQASVAGHDPETGALLWRTDYPGGQPNVAAPVALEGDRLLVSSGYGVGSKAYRVTAEAVPALLWETPRLKSKFANLVVHGGYVYGLDDGVLTCLDPASGERRVEGRPPRARPAPAGGRLLLVQTEDGELVLLEANPQTHRELPASRPSTARRGTRPRWRGGCCSHATTARPPPSSCRSSERRPSGQRQAERRGQEDRHLRA